MYLPNNDNIDEMELDVSFEEMYTLSNGIHPIKLYVISLYLDWSFDFKLFKTLHVSFYLKLILS